MAYTQEEKAIIVKYICDEIAEKGISLRKVLLQKDFEQDGMVYKIPAMSTWASWVNSDDKESKQYARTYTSAIELRAEKHFDEIFEIADDVGNDVILNEDGFPVENHKVIQRDRLRVDARKWALSKMFPKKFGDKIAVDAKVEEIKPLRLVPPPKNAGQ